MSLCTYDTMIRADFNQHTMLASFIYKSNITKSWTKDCRRGRRNQEALEAKVYLMTWSDKRNGAQTNQSLLNMISTRFSCFYYRVAVFWKIKLFTHKPVFDAKSSFSHHSLIMEKKYMALTFLLLLQPIIKSWLFDVVYPRSEESQLCPNSMMSWRSILNFLNTLNVSNIPLECVFCISWCWASVFCRLCRAKERGSMNLVSFLSFFNLLVHRLRRSMLSYHNRSWDTYLWYQHL